MHGPCGAAHICGSFQDTDCTSQGIELGTLLADSGFLNMAIGLSANTNEINSK